MKGHASSFSETGYPRRCGLIEQLLNEEVQLISAVIECDSPDRRDRLCVWLGVDRPEFIDEVEGEEKEWCKLMDLWPYAYTEKLDSNCVFAKWGERGVRLGKLVQLNSLSGLELRAVYVLTEMAGEGGFGEDAEDEFGFLIVNNHGVLRILSQSEADAEKTYLRICDDRDIKRELLEICRSTHKLGV